MKNTKDYKTQRLKETNSNVFKNLYDFSYPMTEILPRLYLGNAFNARDYYELNNKDVKLIINCTEEFPNFFQDDPTIEYINIPILDENNIDISKYFDTIADKIHNHYNTTQSSILIHCFMGASRSVAIMCAYLIKYNNMTVEDALTYIESLRPLINLNVDFFFQLIEWQMTLRNF
jgi:protein-tyrosine phosphatase